VRITSQILALTATASATVLIASGLITPASAFFGSFPGDSRAAPQQPAETARPTFNPPRAPMASRRLATARPQSSAVGKTPVADEPKITAPLQIIISLDKQHLTVYAGDQPIAQSRVSSGQRGRSTPTGVFSIIQKDRWHRSNLYDDAPMWFMQRITWSGVALHQGVVPNYPASHGCVRLPEAFAQKLWGMTKPGARVIIARNELAPIAISHPLLFTRKSAPVASAAPTPSHADYLKAAQQAWTFADLANKAPLVGATLTDLPSFSVPMVDPPAAAKPQQQTRSLKPGPVSVFISRREGKLFVRKGFEPVFDIPVTIANPEQPLGTHVYTAIAANDDNASMRWTVVSTAAAAPGSSASASGALDRITIPQDAVDQISELMSVGASLIVSDQGLGPETGKGTDFIVLTK
jgi:lipoprotein-anchoring transpeptidase ErfK/SrfK